MAQLVGVVLAGGSGRRMGRAKGDIAVDDGVSLAELVNGKEWAVLASPVVVSASPLRIVK